MINKYDKDNTNKPNNLLVDVWKLSTKDFNIAIYNNDATVSFERIFDNYCKDNYICLYTSIDLLKQYNLLSEAYIKGFSNRVNLFQISKCSIKASAEEKISIIIQTIGLLKKRYGDTNDELYYYILSRLEEELFNFE